MLYNTKWDQKPDVFSTASLITWLETQKPDARYNYLACKECLLSQYFKAMGFGDVHVDPWYAVLNGEKHSLPKGWDYIARGGRISMNSCTPFSDRWKYGLALARARSAVLNEENKVRELVLG